MRLIFKCNEIMKLWFWRYMAPLKKNWGKSQQTIGTGSSPSSIRFRLATTSRMSKFGILVLQPVPMPSAPFTSTMGIMGQYHSGSIRWLSSKRFFSNASSLELKTCRASGLQKQQSMHNHHLQPVNDALLCKSLHADYMVIQKYV